jgi:hypothetical protein
MRIGGMITCLAVLAMRIGPVAQQVSSVIVIRGVTLIDGTGRPPLANATVVVQAIASRRSRPSR